MFITSHTTILMFLFALIVVEDNLMTHIIFYEGFMTFNGSWKNDISQCTGEVAQITCRFSFEGYLINKSCGWSSSFALVAEGHTDIFLTPQSSQEA